MNAAPSVEQNVEIPKEIAQIGDNPPQNVAAVEEMRPKSKIIRPDDLIPNETTVPSKQGEPYSELVERMEKQAQKDKPKRLKDMTDEEAAAWADEVKEEYWKTVDRAKQQAEVIAAQNGDDVITVTVKNKNRQKVSKSFVNQDKLRMTKIKDRYGNLVDVVYIDDGSGKIGRVFSPENVMPDKNFTADTPDGKKTYSKYLHSKRTLSDGKK